jgi:hypothetical protein
VLGRKGGARNTDGSLSSLASSGDANSLHKKAEAACCNQEQGGGLGDSGGVGGAVSGVMVRR